MCAAGQPDFQIDWAAWAAIDRQASDVGPGWRAWADCPCPWCNLMPQWVRRRGDQEVHRSSRSPPNPHPPTPPPLQVLQKTGGATAAAGAQQEGPGGADQADDVIVGPWMDSWPLTHSNRHVEAWLAGKRATTKA